MQILALYKERKQLLCFFVTPCLSQQ